MADARPDAFPLLTGAGLAETDRFIVFDASAVDTKGMVPDEVAAGLVALSGIARTSDITAAINALINSAPGALDTLNELAAALGNDASFATTMTNALAAKIALSIIDGKGELLVGTANDAVDNLPAGTNNHVPVYDSALSMGMKTQAPRSIPAEINSQSVDYTLALTDAGKVIRQTGASKTITFPPDSTVDIPDGCEGVIVAANGPVTLAPGAGVVLSDRPPLTTLVMVGTGSQVVWRKKTTDTYELIGDLISFVRTPVMVQITDPNGSALIVGDGQGPRYWVPPELGGYNLVAAYLYVSTVSTSGLPTLQIRNVTQTADMLTTKLTIDANEKTSHTAATAVVIDAANKDVATGDEIAFDIDVAGTGAKGLALTMVFSQ